MKLLSSQIHLPNEHKVDDNRLFDKLYVMSKTSAATDVLPPAAASALRSLGVDLGLARRRRKESLKNWALRMNVSVPTLMRMERGDATVGMGVYVTALWLMGRHTALGDVADPKEDMGALELELRQAKQRHQPNTAERTP